MKKLIILTFIGFILTGCWQPQSTPMPIPPAPPSEHKLQIEVKPAPSPFPSPLAPIPIASPNYMMGYWDGYYGRVVTWRWAIIDYRQGWTLGNHDRLNGLVPGDRFNRRIP